MKDFVDLLCDYLGYSRRGYDSNIVRTKLRHALAKYILQILDAREIVHPRDSREEGTTTPPAPPPKIKPKPLIDIRQDTRQDPDMEGAAPGDGLRQKSADAGEAAYSAAAPSATKPTHVRVVEVHRDAWGRLTNGKVYTVVGWQDGGPRVTGDGGDIVWIKGSKWEPVPTPGEDSEDEMEEILRACMPGPVYPYYVDVAVMRRRIAAALRRAGYGKREA